MRLLITGTPGTGKTTLAKKLGKLIKCAVINEKDFALKNSIGSFNDENELEIPLEEFEKKANAYLKENDNVIFEGHTMCEMKIKVDKAIVIKMDPEQLEMRLEQRSYSMEKIMDNVFCEGINYCKKQLLKNFKETDIIEVISQAQANTTLALVVSELNGHI
jgi:adenylate kinase